MYCTVELYCTFCTVVQFKIVDRQAYLVQGHTDILSDSVTLPLMGFKICRTAGPYRCITYKGPMQYSTVAKCVLYCTCVSASIILNYIILLRDMDVPKDYICSIKVGKVFFAVVKWPVN